MSARLLHFLCLSLLSTVFCEPNTHSQHGIDEPNPDIITIVKQILHRMEKMDNETSTYRGKTGERLSRLERKANDTVQIEFNQLLMSTQYKDKYRKEMQDIPFKDMLWMTNQKDYIGKISVLEKFKSEVGEFESIWGDGSIKSFMEILHQMDRTEQKRMWFEEIKRIKTINKLKFVESPMRTTPVYGQFGKDDAGVFVQGYVNVKTDDEWHPINAFYCLSNLSYPHKDFGNKEANVACRDGGYSSGTFLGNEHNLKKFPWLKYVEVICSGKENHLTECKYKVHNFNHWLSNVKVKCYF